MTLPLREIQGKYEILRKIKEGGMGSIYKVRHLLLDEVRIIKVIKAQFSDDEALQRRFRREAKAAIRLKHQNVAQLYDFSVDETGNAYIVMEFIDGVTLLEMLQANGPPPIDLTLEIARQSLRALSYLHQLRYIHRDVSPDNIMVTRDAAGQPLAKLIDLGIVKRLEGDNVDLTRTGMFLGKLRYAAPEHFSGAKAKLDQRSDLYSFGVLLYEVLTGHFPCPGDNVQDLMAAHLFRPPLSFDESDPDGNLGDDLREVLLYALEKEPEKRIGSAEEFIEILDRQEITAPLRQSLDETLSTTIRALAQDEGTARPGSTQSRIDGEFGMVKTPDPSAVPLSLAKEPDDRTSDVADLYRSAQQLIDDDSLIEARQQLYRLLAIDPDHCEAKERLSSVEVALAEAAEIEQQRAEAIAAVAEQVEEEIRSEQLEEAVTRLSAGRKEIGDVTRFRELDAKILRLGHELEERRREEAITESIETVEQYLEAEDLENAQQRLALARAEFGELRRFRALEERITRLREETQRKHEEATRRAQIAEFLAEAVELAANGNFVDAMSRAAAVLGLDPNNAQAEEQLLEYQEAQAEEIQKQKREEAISQAVASVAQQLKKERSAEAADALEAAKAELGEDPRFEGLKAVLEKLGRDRAVADTVKMLREDLKAERLDEADLAVSQAVEADSGFSFSALVSAKPWTNPRVWAAASVLLALAVTVLWMIPDSSAPTEEAAISSLIDGPETSFEAGQPESPVTTEEAEVDSSIEPETASATAEGTAAIPEVAPPVARLSETGSPSTSPETVERSPVDSSASAAPIEASTPRSPPGLPAPEDTSAPPPPVIVEEQVPVLETEPLLIDAIADSPPQLVPEEDTGLQAGEQTLELVELPQSALPTAGDEEIVLDPTPDEGGVDEPDEAEQPAVAEPLEAESPTAIAPREESAPPVVARAGERPPLTNGPGVVPPRRIHLPTPRYPASALLGRQRARVVVSVLVDETGKVTEMRVKSSDVRKLLGFEKAALDSARRAVYEPATENGSPWRMWTDILFVFGAR